MSLYASRPPVPCTSSEDSTGRWSPAARRAPPSRKPHNGPTDARTYAGCWDHRGQSRPGLGGDSPHPGSSGATELRDPGSQRAQRETRARSGGCVRGQRGLLGPRGAGSSTKHRHRRCYGQGPAPSRALLRRAYRRQGRLRRVATRPRPRRRASDGRARLRAGGAHGRRVASPPGPGDRWASSSTCRP
jgi:hypothetical protein